jgi:hypothetical protein
MVVLEGIDPEYPHPLEKPVGQEGDLVIENMQACILFDQLSEPVEFGSAEYP